MYYEYLEVQMAVVLIWLLSCGVLSGVALGSIETTRHGCPPEIEVFASLHEEFGFQVGSMRIFGKTSIYINPANYNKKQWNRNKKPFVHGIYACYS